MDTRRENLWQEVGINFEWIVKESLHVEKTLKLSSEEWEGANYIKGKERNFQAKRTESTNILCPSLDNNLIYKPIGKTILSETRGKWQTEERQKKPRSPLLRHRDYPMLWPPEEITCVYDSTRARFKVWFCHFLAMWLLEPQVDSAVKKKNWLSSHKEDMEET